MQGCSWLECRQLCLLPLRAVLFLVDDNYVVVVGLVCLLCSKPIHELVNELVVESNPSDVVKWSSFLGSCCFTHRA